jgi:7-carboxy-7-deazaguanine synthase
LDIIENGPKNVTITGGEPMMQMKALNDLCVELVSAGYRVSVETNGSLSFSPIAWVNYVVDFKLPSSEEYHHMKVETPWMFLRSTDWIKFVVADNPDYEVAKATIEMLKRKGCKAQFAMSPLHSKLSGNRILQWLKLDRMFDVVLNLQLHKLVDLNEPD